MRNVVASDLDRTLIWSSRAVTDPAGAVCVEWYDGKPLSYVAAEVEEQLAELVAGGHLVPVTTRTEAQLLRVRLPGGPARLAICLNGGRVLVDGVEDPTHRDRVREELAAAAPQAEVGALLAQWALSVVDPIGACRVREAEGMFHYAVFDERLEPSPEIDALRAEAEQLGWQTSVQGRKLYMVPRTLTKEAALQHLEQQHGVRVVASAGDSLLDAGMLAAFGPGWVPVGSELDRVGQLPPGARLTVTSDLAAGAEIVRALAAAVDAEPSKQVLGR